MRVTAANLAKAINNLNKNIIFEYISSKNKGKIKIVEVTLPEGPIKIIRYNPSKGENFVTKSYESISAQMLWRVANAINEETPFNLDRILGASYNTRSVLESLLAYTPEFYHCSPGRIELASSTSDIKPGHKHLVWLPTKPHENNVLAEIKTNQVISEIPNMSVVYDAILPSVINPSNEDINEITTNRRHLQIQIALIMIGQKLGFRTWIAHNDKGFSYNNRKVGDIEGVIPRLADERVLQAYPEGISAALQIDCIWFKNGRFMPAVMEVEHSTGVTSGLNRMKRFQDLGPNLSGIRWVIVAPDEDREDVMRKASQPQFRSLNALFFPYSAVDELFSLCQRRNLSGNAVNEEFLDCFMEKCIS